MASRLEAARLAARASMVDAQGRRRVPFQGPSSASLSARGIGLPSVFEQWTVLPHGDLVKIGDGILTVQGEIVMPLGRFPRRMTVVRLSGHRLAVFSAIALREREMARIEDMGLPTILIVPSESHRMDSKIWKQRFLSMEVVTPPAAKAEVAEAVPVDATSDILEDPQVRFLVVPGTGGHEAALVVSRDGETTLIVNDIIAHVAHPRGLGAKIMGRLFGFGVKRPQTPWLVRKKIVEDKAALAAQFRAWARIPDLKRIIPSHGDIISADPAGTLNDLAARLGG